jgi:hypothetical protein
LRSHALKFGEQLQDTAAVRTVTAASAITVAVDGLHP